MRNGNELPRSADIIVVGGGVVGLAIAREVRRRGADVVLIERGLRTGAEASHAAAGMLAPQVEANNFDAFFALACASRDAYPNFARELREETGVDIELERTGTLYLAFTEEDEEECARRFSWQARAGLQVERLTAKEARALEPQLSPQVRCALRFPLDGQVENRRLAQALAQACKANGVAVCEQTEAISIRVESGRAGSVETSRGRIEAGTAVVVAGGAWSSLVRLQVSSAGDGNGDAPVPVIEPVRGQMLCFAPRSAPPLVRHVVYSPRGYLVPRRDGRLLAGTTTERAGFDKSVTDEGREAITAQAREIAPAVAELTVSEAWAGLRPRGADDWPLLGASSEAANLFYATGHYRNGILLAPLTGALVAEMILTGVVPHLLQPFAPAHFRRARAV